MDSWTKNYTVAASATYVTGSHTFKAGMNYGWGNRIRIWPTPNPANISQLRFTNSVPDAGLVRNTPIDESIEKMNADFGVFAQDAWTMNRLTLNIGGALRLLQRRSAGAVGAGEHVGARARPAGRRRTCPNWKDWAIRAGGRLRSVRQRQDRAQGATSASTSRRRRSGFAEAFNTMTAADRNAHVERRSTAIARVLDANGNLQRNEILGGTANFGQASGTDRPDPALQREYNWEYGAPIQHELFPRVSVTAGYHRRTFGNLAVTDNLNLSVDEWTPFTITAPLDERLPGRRRLSDHDVHAEPEQGRHGDRQPAHVLDDEHARLQRRRRQRAGARSRDPGVPARRRHARAARDRPPAISATTRTACASATVGPFRTMFKLAGSYELPYGTFRSAAASSRGRAPASPRTTPSPARIAGRPIIGSTAGATQIDGQSGRAEHDVPRLHQPARSCAFARTFRVRHATACRGWWTIYNMLNAGTVTDAQHDVRRECRPRACG